MATNTTTKLICDELISLPEKNLLLSRDKYDVYLSESKEIPNILIEIGKLRERSFREIGEGTGNEVDIDSYDQHYLQLFLWDRAKTKIVGGYRIGCGDYIIREIGTNGLYISSLFFIKKDFHKIMKESIELGRSYIIKEYQKERLPLFLMWKGILSFLLKNPQYKYVYGPVSISKNYSEASRSLMVSFVKKHLYDKEMAKMLKPITPYKIIKLEKEIKVFLKKSKGELNKLDDFITNLEPDHIKLPVLMKQYIKQNANFIGFNLDPNFSDALDGFMILDISNLPKETLEFLNQEK